MANEHELSDEELREICDEAMAWYPAADSPVVRLPVTVVPKMAFGYAQGVIAERLRQIVLEDRLASALNDMLAGWRYIRRTHGDLDGVGWERCEKSASEALGAAERRRARAQAQAPVETPVAALAGALVRELATCVAASTELLRFTAPHCAESKRITALLESAAAYEAAPATKDGAP